MSPFERAPFVAIWETTRACALACVHCRPEAIAHRDPRELSCARCATWGLDGSRRIRCVPA